MVGATIERQKIGSGASWAGAGILPAANEHTSLHPFEQLRGLSHRLHAEWAEQLLGETGIDNGFRRCGGLYLARTFGEMAALIGWKETLEEEKIPCCSIPAAEIRKIEPALSELSPQAGFRYALQVPGECQVRNPHHLDALRRACELRGVLIEENAEVINFDQSEYELQGVCTSHDVFKADRYVITTGAWTSLLAHRLDCNLGILPIRGQILLFNTPRKSFRHIINEGSRYLVPRDDGRVLVGATEEEVGFDSSTTEEALVELREFAYELIPALRAATIEKQWSGLRPASFDGWPYLGRLPNLVNTFVAAAISVVACTYPQALLCSWLIC